MKGIVYNIQRMSTKDGPGLRTTVFLKGCPLHCPWCSNPESQSFKPQLMVFTNVPRSVPTALSSRMKTASTTGILQSVPTVANVPRCVLPRRAKCPAST